MILFVCTGNTCRSPMAAALCEKLTGRQCDSAGIAPMVGAPASENAVFAMKDYGIDITCHRAKPVSHTLLKTVELVITMTLGHATFLKQAAPEYAFKIVTLYEWAGKSGDVLDPFGQPKEGYIKCAKEIEELINEGDKLH